MPHITTIRTSACQQGANVSDRSVIEPKNTKLNNSRNFNIPHSPGIRANGFIFLSGMVALNPETGERVRGTVQQETRQILDNARHLLESAGSSLEKAVRVHVLLNDPADWAAMNEVYREYFPEAPPARSAYGVSLTNGIKVEIEITAVE
jgi:2-iminobutanoate/2-iminopropanoate deaminase